RPVDLLLAILPAAPPRDRRQERFDALLFELLADDLLVARAGPQRVPTHLGIRGRCDLRCQVSGIRFQAGFRHQASRSQAEGFAASASSCFFRCSSACSYAFFSSSLCHVMVAAPRSFSMYFCVSSRRFSSAILSLMSWRASSNVFTFVSVRDSS